MAAKKKYDSRKDPEHMKDMLDMDRIVREVHKYHADVVDQLGKYGIKDIIQTPDKDGKLSHKHIEVAPGIYKPRDPKKQEQWRQDKLKELPSSIANIYKTRIDESTYSTNVKTGVKTKYSDDRVSYDVSRVNDALDQHIVKHMTSNTGKVDQSALPKTSEKPVASKKKTEPTPTSAETKKPTAKKASERTAKPAEKPVDKTKTASGRKFPDVNKKPVDKNPASKPSTSAKTATPKSDPTAPAEKKNTGKYMVTYDPTGTTKLDKAEYVNTPEEAKARAGKDKGRKERMAEREANPAPMPDANLKPQSEWSTSSTPKTDPEFHDWSDDDAGIAPSSPSSSSSSSSPTAEPAKEKKPGLWSRIKKSVAGSEAKYESGPVVDDDGGMPKGEKPPKSEPVSEDGTGSWEPEPKATGGRGGHFAAGHGGPPTFGSQRNLGSSSGGGGATRDDGRTIQANQNYGSNISNGAVTGAKFGINDNTFGAGSGPVVASTAGKATSDNPEATVLSTGGDAKQTHPRAQNASRGGRQTTKNSVRTRKP